MKELHIVLAEIEGSPDHSFVEIEDEEGRSHSVGTWRERPDGLSEIVITKNDVVPYFDSLVDIDKIDGLF